jgi:hypothetical protein
MSITRADCIDFERKQAKGIAEWFGNPVFSAC